jgi:DNA replication protein DnaC
MKLRLPRRFEKARITKVDKSIFEGVHEYAQDLGRNLQEGDGLLLSGPPGVGKTYAVSALTAHMVEFVRIDHEFVTAPDFFVNLRQAEHDWNVRDTYRDQSWFDTYTRVPWFVLNDLGKEFVPKVGNEWTVYALGRVLRARSEWKRSTFVTTNMDGKAMSKTYGESVTSLMAETMTFYMIPGEDKRLRRRA